MNIYATTMNVAFYQNIKNQRDEVYNLLDSFPLLREIFNDTFFGRVDQEISAMEAAEINGPIHPMFRYLELAKDREDDQLPLFEEYLEALLSHYDTTPTHKKHIITELTAGGHLFRMFEINILGNIVTQMPANQVRFDPITIGKKRSDAAIKLIDREVFLEISMLGEAEPDRKKREEAMYAKRRMEGGSIDIDAGIERFAKKITDKGQQLPPGKPSVVVIQVFDFFPLDFQVEQAVNQCEFPNVGAIFQFDRIQLKRVMVKGCDLSNQLRDDELVALKNILSGSSYRPLIFGS